MLPPDPRGETMCQRCDHLEVRIHQFQRFLAQLTDAPTIERLAAAVEEMKARIAALHPDKE
jgi:regulator of sirC expression with transglutaminase-like and TPR domain